MPLTVARFPALPSRRSLSLALLGFLIAGMVWLARAQAAQQPEHPAIAAASVRWLCLDIACRRFPQGFVADPTHYDCDLCNMWNLILPAYGLKIPSQFQGAPGWFGDDYYQVRIVAAAPAASRTQMERSLLQGVLTRCFALRVRRVDRQIPGYALEIAPGGIRFPRVAKAVPPRTAGVVHFADVATLAVWLNQYYYGGKLYGVTRPVHDATGLSGIYDIPVPFPQPETGTNLLAVISRLGLLVKPAPGTATSFDILHVDHLSTSCVLP